MRTEAVRIRSHWHLTASANARKLEGLHVGWSCSRGRGFSNTRKPNSWMASLYRRCRCCICRLSASTKFVGFVETSDRFFGYDLPPKRTCKVQPLGHLRWVASPPHSSGNKDKLTQMYTLNLRNVTPSRNFLGKDVLCSNLPPSYHISLSNILSFDTKIAHQRI